MPLTVEAGEAVRSVRPPRSGVSPEVSQCRVGHRGGTRTAEADLFPTGAAQVYLLSAKEGGRRTGFASSYRPQFFFRTCDVVGEVELTEVPIALPGDTVELAVTLGRPIAMDGGLGFAIREGGRTVGAGRVTKIIE